MGPFLNKAHSSSLPTSKNYVVEALLYVFLLHLNFCDCTHIMILKKHLLPGTLKLSVIIYFEIIVDILFTKCMTMVRVQPPLKEGHFNNEYNKWLYLYLIFSLWYCIFILQSFFRTTMYCIQKKCRNFVLLQQLVTLWAYSRVYYIVFAVITLLLYLHDNTLPKKMLLI